jgi:hypothetical protein
VISGKAGIVQRKCSTLRRPEELVLLAARLPHSGPRSNTGKDGEQLWRSEKWRDDDGISVVLSHPFVRCLGLPRNLWF